MLGGVRMEGFTTSATMNVTGISTFRNDITLTGSQAGVTSIFFDASADTLQFQDQSKLKFGAGSDLSIYHDSENSYIDDSGTGNLTIRSSQINFDKYTGESLARFRSDGNCELFYNNVSRFKTADGGTITTGIATADGFSDRYQLAIEDQLVSSPNTGGSQNPLVRSDMVYFEGPCGGAVFSVGSISWCSCLSYNHYTNNVSRITENVLRHFARDDAVGDRDE